MPFIGLGLHFLIAIFFAVHALRTGRQMYWLLILFSFPLLGSIVYFLVEYLPASRVNRTINKAANAAVNLLDPEREYREAQQAWDLTPTAQNKIRLARACLNRGNAAEAADHYRDALQGPFASDPELRFGLASALVECGGDTQAAGALEQLETLARDRADFRRDEVALLQARALAALGRTGDARRAFDHAVGTHNTVEARARFIVWLALQGETGAAQQQLEALRGAAKHWPSHARSINRDWMRMAEAALKA